jgi:hypothetical protein
VQELSLHRAAHYNHVAFAWVQDDVGGILAGRGAVDVGQRAPSTNDERTTLSEHHDGDHRVVEPSQFAIAVQTLVIGSISIENCSYATEPVPISRLEVELGLSKEWAAVGAKTRAQSPLRNVSVVAQYLRLRPWC